MSNAIKGSGVEYIPVLLAFSRPIALGPTRRSLFRITPLGTDQAKKVFLQSHAPQTLIQDLIRHYFPCIIGLMMDNEVCGAS